MKATYSATLRGTSPEAQGSVLWEWVSVVSRDLSVVGSSSDHCGEGEISLTVSTGSRERPDWDPYVWAALDLALSRPGREGSSATDQRRTASS